MVRAIAWAAALLLSVNAGHAAPIDAYSAVGFLGDSLTDTGNEYQRTDGRRPADPPYYKGRASNGLVWADYFSQAFVERGKPVVNKAYAGARAAGSSDGTPSITRQVGLLLSERPTLGDRPLVAVLGGGNDIIDEARRLASPFTLRRRTEDAAKSAARAILASFDAVAASEIGDVIGFTLPDLGDIPAFAAIPIVRDIVGDATRIFNKRLRRGLADLRLEGVRVDIVRLDRLLDRIYDDPAAYGVKHTKMPCILPGLSVCDNPGKYTFYDQLHPTTEIHEVLADAVAEKVFPSELSARLTAATVAVTPVPLPAGPVLLLSALGLLGLGRRRAVRSA